MKFADFIKKSAQEKKHVYLLAGEEPFYIERAEKFLYKIFGATKESVQSFETVSFSTLLEAIDTIPFFSEQNIVLVNNLNFLKEKETPKKNEILQEKFFQRLEKMPEATVVIFKSDKAPDKRQKFFKIVNKVGFVLEADCERPWTIENSWLKDKLLRLNRSLDAAALAYFKNLVSVTNSISLSFWEKEFDKLALSSEKKIFTRADLEKNFSDLPAVSTFAMIDAINEKNVKRAIFLLEKQIQDGVFLPLILATLVRHVRQLLQVKDLQARKIFGQELARELEVAPFVAQKLLQSAKNFDADHLEECFLKLTDADYFLKTGQGGAELLEAIVVNLCRKK